MVARGIIHTKNKGDNMTKKKHKDIVKKKDGLLQKYGVEFKNGGDSLNIGMTEDTLNNIGFKKTAGVESLLLKFWETVAFIGLDEEKIKTELNRSFALLLELNPRDAFETQLVTQMITSWNNAMDCFVLARRNREYLDTYLKFQNQGSKLMRLYCQQLEALDKHRNKGKQKMTIEHVHVHKGGQDIVGNIDQTTEKK